MQVMIYAPDNIYLLVGLGVFAIIFIIRVIRWVLDILP